jgi:choline dehydrogenase-like flavoprotein
LLTGLQATRILLEGRHAVAVEARSQHGELSVRGTREIVLTAGALQSPQLLMLSGVGDGEHLQSVGIEVRHALRGVGRNLHDHVAGPVHMVTADPTSYGLSWRALPRNLWAIAQYVFARRGPIANNIFESAAFVKTAPHLDRPDLQLVFQPAKRPSPFLPLPLGHGFGLSAVPLYPKSRGRLTLESPDPLAPPRADPNLLADPADLEAVVSGIRFGRRVFAHAAFARYRATEVAPGPAIDSDADLTAYIRAQSYTVHHPVGTCRIGLDADAVVDPELRVSGIEGLRIADASVFPSIIGGNTNATVVMVAEKAADLILGRPAPTPLPI